MKLRPTSILAIAGYAGFALLLDAGTAWTAPLGNGPGKLRRPDSIAIVKLVDLDFGRLSSGSAGGRVVVAPAGGRSVSGDVTGHGGSVAAAQFEVTGQRNFRYDIILPRSTVIASKSHQMTVDSFTSSKRRDRGRLGRGVDTFSVGAALNVNADQPPGNYSGSFFVAVSYQ